MVTQQDKLDILQRLDPRWPSLNNRIRCTRCGTVFAAADIAVLGGSRGFGPLRLHCPNEACEATPADWISAFRQSPNKQTGEVSATHDGRVFRVRRAKLVRRREAVAAAQTRSFFHFVAAALDRLNRGSGSLSGRTRERFRIAGIP
jgi:predicted  nucleic acid-binding Zn-ribbon protein